MCEIKRSHTVFSRLLVNIILYAEKIVQRKSELAKKAFKVKIKPEFSKYFLLEKGRANFCRPDNYLIISNVFSPYVIGLLFHPGSQVYYSIALGLNDCLCQIARLRIQHLINKLDLYKASINAMTYKISLFLHRDKCIQRYKFEDIINNMLVYLIVLPDDFRFYTSVLKFIEQRTTFSCC
jgi:hypothetical protein